MEMVCFEEEESGLAAKQRQQQTSFNIFLTATLKKVEINRYN